MECLFCHPPPDECTDEAINLLVRNSKPCHRPFSRQVYRSVMRGAAPFACQFLWTFEPHFDGHLGPAWLSARIPIGDQWRPCMLLITGKVNFCHGVWALLRRSRVVRWCLRVPANGILLPVSIPARSVWPVVAHVQECCRVVCLDVGASDFRNFLD